MTAALVGAASCARCGGELGRPAALCPACGTLLLPAASGRVLGTSSPLLAGVVRASTARRRIALALDVLPFAAAVVVGLLLAARGAYVDLALLILLTFGLLAASLALLLSRGRSLGRLLTGLRTVDNLTGLPLRLRRLVGRIGHRRRSSRTLTVRLATGRDPLHTAPAALLGTDVAEGPAPEAALFAPSGPADALRPAASETVALVFDTGRRHLLRGTLLIGRRPENSHSTNFADPRRPAVDHPLLGLADLSRTLSKTHVLLEWSGTVLWVTDLQSANGTVLRSPRGERRPLTPGVPAAAGIGWTVQCGARSFSVHASSEQGGTTPLGPPAAPQDHTGGRPSE
ncbi:MAG TPA: FHA domain-containing protein, partial [Propionibacteriaceae bacterium]|nr:FHA domain-containing protein [Propionibacteriaceae bacterium]